MQVLILYMQYICNIYYKLLYIYKCNTGIIYRYSRLYRKLTPIYTRNGYCRYYDKVLSIQYLTDPLNTAKKNVIWNRSMQVLDIKYQYVYLFYYIIYYLSLSLSFSRTIYIYIIMYYYWKNTPQLCIKFANLFLIKLNL